MPEQRLRGHAERLAIGTAGAIESGRVPKQLESELPCVPTVSSQPLVLGEKVNND